jgi:capsular exopolysaccharide synthesis family protein
MNELLAGGSKFGSDAGTEISLSNAGVISPHVRGEKVVTIGKSRRNLDPRLISLLNPNSLDAERYRRLRQSVEDFRDANNGTVIAVTSPLAGDGKSLTSLNLAGSLAQDPCARVLLIELDLRQKLSNMKDYMGMKKIPGPGVVDKVLNEDIKWEQSVCYIADFNLYFMPTGRSTESPYEILNSPRLGLLLEEARQRYDFVILDTAPVVLLPDCQLISKWVDGFMMVVAADRTPKKMLEEAFNLMDPKKIMGLVFNGYNPISDNYYKGYY